MGKAILTANKDGINAGLPLRVDAAHFHFNELGEKVLDFMVVTDEVSFVKVTPGETLPADPIAGYKSEPSQADIDDAILKQAEHDQKIADEKAAKEAKEAENTLPVEPIEPPKQD